MQEKDGFRHWGLGERAVQEDTVDKKETLNNADLRGQTTKVRLCSLVPYGRYTRIHNR
jgi:hypothetical protein